MSSFFDVPKGAIAKVSVIDTTIRISGIPASVLLQPPLDGFDVYPPVPAWSFLVESSTGEKAIFDLGMPPDIEALSPSIVGYLRHHGWTIEVKQHVADILRSNGVDPAEIGSIIWSHWHWDHIGDPATFPPSTDLVVGPGFKDKFLPAFPVNPDSPLKESYFTGRKLREIDFADQTQSGLKAAGALRAFDFFGDGSFYLLDTPGHAVGHLSGLARTTISPDTFIFMGGDLCHHGAEIRPSPYLPLPAQLPFPLPEALRSRFTGCPGAVDLLAPLNTKRDRRPDQPFFDPASFADLDVAIDTIGKTQPADACDNIFFVFAHDGAVEGVVDLFPQTANHWKEKGWADKIRWSFLKDLTTLEILTP